MGKKISALDAISSVSGDDLLAVVDDPAGTPTTKKATVAQVLAAGSSRGTFASRPAAGVAGRIYFATDAPIVSHDNGSSWATYQIGTPPLTAPPAVAGFTAINAGGRTTTSTDSFGGIKMVAIDGANVSDYRLRKVTAPVVAYSLTVHLVASLPFNYAFAGICWRNSTTGNCIVFGLITYTSTAFGGGDIFARYITADSNGASPAYTDSTTKILDALPPLGTGGIWLRLTDDLATTRTYEVSLDGINYLTLLSEARTTSITPDEIGLCIAPRAAVNGSATQACAWFNHWVAV